LEGGELSKLIPNGFTIVVAIRERKAQIIAVVTPLMRGIFLAIHAATKPARQMDSSARRRVKRVPIYKPTNHIRMADSTCMNTAKPTPNKIPAQFSMSLSNQSIMLYKEYANV
jgi:hypothetical protein